MSMSAIQRRITNKARLGLAPKVNRKSANEKILKRKGKFLTETDLIAKRDIIGGRRLTVGYGVGGRVPNQQGGTKSQNAIAIDARSQNANGTGINILSRSSNGDSYITFQRDDPAQAAFASGDEWTAGLDAHGTTGGNRFKVSVSNALSTNDRFVLDLSGNSFIGINPPNSLSHSLELSKTSGDIAIDFDINGTDKFILGVDDDDGDKFKISGGGALGTNDRIAIDSSGSVGIGTSTPDGQLTVSGAEGGDGIINLWADDGDDNQDKMRLRNNNGDIIIESYESGSWVNVLMVDYAGRLSGTSLLDEDDMSTNSAVKIATQQSIKAYVDAHSDGWYGSTTRVKILHSDFIPDDGGRPIMIDDTGSDRWIESDRTSSMYASVPIPTGYTATHVNIYGSATSAITVYEADINSKTVTSKGTGNIGTEIDITDVASDTTNYILVELAQANGEEVYGGYMTIAAT